MDDELTKEDIKKWDLAKRYPGYFQRKIIVPGLFLILTLVFVALWQNNFKSNFCYVSCPENSGRNCPNQLYVCQSGQEELEMLNQGLTCQHEDFRNKLKSCSDEIFTTKFLFPGQTIGNKPTSLLQNINGWGFSILFFTFLINHIYYKRNRNETRTI